MTDVVSPAGSPGGEGAKAPRKALSRVIFFLVVVCVLGQITLAGLFVMFPRVQELTLQRLGELSVSWSFVGKYADLSRLAKMARSILLFGCTIAGAFIVEAVFLGWNKSSVRKVFFTRSNSVWYDIIFYVVGLTRLMGPLTLVGSLGISYLSGVFANALLKAITSFNLKIATGLPWADFGIYFLSFTFFDYWSHRLFHAGPFWYLHRFHHSATEMTLLTTGRNHPMALAIEPFVKVWAGAFIGMPPEFMGVFFVVVSFHQMIVHSMLPWTWGWFGRWVLMSPAAHRTHHSPMVEHYDTNFSILSLWDQLFGTWYAGTVVNETVGIPEPVHNSGNLVRELWTDAKLFGRGLLGRSEPKSSEPSSV